MWVSKVKRSYDHMNGIFLFYKPVARNSYFALEKQNTKYLITDKKLLPKEYFSKSNNNGDDIQDGEDKLKEIYKTIKKDGVKKVIDNVLDKQKSISLHFKQIKQNTSSNNVVDNSNSGGINEMNKVYGLPGNDVMVPFTSLQSNEEYTTTPVHYSFLTKLWIRMIPYLPVSYLLKPNETYRIISYIDPLEPTLISISSNYKDIELHWKQIENDLFNSLKVLPTPKEKQFRLDSFLNIKLHSFPTHLQQ